MKRLLHWGPVTALTIIVSLFLVSCLVIASWYPPIDGISTVHSIVFGSWVWLILWHFFKAAFGGPGFVPFNWKPEDAKDEDYLQFCEACQGYKAPRAHHCKRCKRCVMKMDHHCPWINNCVGHRNHKSFALFLIFVVIGCTHAAIMKIWCVFDHLLWMDGHLMMKVDEDALIQMSHIVLLLVFFGIGLSIGVAGSVAFLLYYQIKSIVLNETGIESWIVEKATSRRLPDEAPFVYPYDLGTWTNIRQVMTLTSDYTGDGIKWPVFEGCNQYSLTIEQIEQKELKRDNIVIYDVIASYSGRFFPCSFGVRTCCDAPWTEEGRLSVEVGDVVHSTRLRKHWAYGVKYSLKHRSQAKVRPALGEDVRQKGWLPLACLEEQSAVDERRSKKRQ